METEARIVVTGVLLGLAPNQFKDASGKWVDQLVAVFPGATIARRLIVTVPKELEDQARADLDGLTGSEVSVLVGSGNYGKLWYHGLA